MLGTIEESQHIHYCLREYSLLTSPNLVITLKHFSMYCLPFSPLHFMEIFFWFFLVLTWLLKISSLIFTLWLTVHRVLQPFFFCQEVSWKQKGHFLWRLPSLVVLHRTTIFLVFKNVRKPKGHWKSCFHIGRLSGIDMRLKNQSIISSWMFYWTLSPWGTIDILKRIVHQ